MIFAHDKGRLCNNILQYGHVYAWAREHGRSSMSMRFAYKYKYFHIGHTLRHNFLLYVFAKYGSRWGLLPVATFNENDDYALQEEKMLHHKNIIVEGWYARWYDLFLKYKDEIIGLFAFDDRMKHRPGKILATVGHDDILLGVHVRRGDYRTFYDGRFFYTDEQYASLIRQFIGLHPGRRVHVVVCGNDRTLDRQAYLQAFPEVAIHFPCGNPGEDLYILSECDYLIGPPSTFSLVAAMYRDVPLYWVKDVAQPLSADSFARFDHLFRHIL